MFQVVLYMQGYPEKSAGKRCVGDWDDALELVHIPEIYLK